MNYKIEKYKKFDDDRGSLIVFLKESELDKKKKKFGQIYFVTFTKKGVVRGNHYHKKWHEWFGIVAGKLEVTLVDVKTKEKVVFILDANHGNYVRLEISPYIAHSFKSLTKYSALLNYANGEWSKKDDFDYKF